MSKHAKRKGHRILDLSVQKVHSWTGISWEGYGESW